MFELTILTKDGRELKRYELSGTRPIKVGRAIDCDIKIGVAQVSRRHAKIEQVDEDEWVFTDLDSTHGSFVKGERIKEAVIEAGLEVMIGPAVLRFENLAHRIGAELNAMLDDGEDVEEDDNMGTSVDEPPPPTDGPVVVVVQSDPPAEPKRRRGLAALRLKKRR